MLFLAGRFVAISVLMKEYSVFVMFSGLFSEFLSPLEFYNHLILIFFFLIVLIAYRFVMSPPSVPLHVYLVCINTTFLIYPSSWLRHFCCVPLESNLVIFLLSAFLG